jgi:predicted O-methyltransferase YrrM
MADGWERWTEVDRYIEQRLMPPDEALDAALAAAEAAGLPAIEVTPTQGKLLHLLARMQDARAILELGTLGGYSTIWLARALAPGGRLVTLEADPRYAEVARASIDRAGLGEVVELRVGPALETLPQVEADGVGPFDLVFIDADKRSTPEYFEWGLRLARPGTVIVADNIVRGGAIVDPEADDAGVAGMRRFLDVAGAEPRVSVTAIQTVGAKGHDGFALALVLEPR